MAESQLSAILTFSQPAKWQTRASHSSEVLNKKKKIDLGQAFFIFYIFHRFLHGVGDRVVSVRTVLNVCCSHPTHNHSYNCAHSRRTLQGSATYFSSLGEFVEGSIFRVSTYWMRVAFATYCSRVVHSPTHKLPHDCAHSPGMLQEYVTYFWSLGVFVGSRIFRRQRAPARR